MTTATTVLVYTQYRLSGPFYQPPAAIGERKEAQFPGDVSESAGAIEQFLAEGAFELDGKTYPRVKQHTYIIEHRRHSPEHFYIPVEEQSTVPMPLA